MHPYAWHYNYIKVGLCTTYSLSLIYLHYFEVGCAVTWQCVVWLRCCLPVGLGDAIRFCVYVNEKSLSCSVV
jgi:hypothetical protein